MNRARRTGTDGENIACECFEELYPHVERRSLKGRYDTGDLVTVPDLVIEVKSGATIDIPGWLRELDVEMDNAAATVGFVFVKPKGKRKPDDCWIIMRPAVVKKMLKEGGWA
jgi:hypothetical protein